LEIESLLVSDAERLQALVDSIMADEGPVGFDIETGFTGRPFPGRALKPEANEITGFSLAASPERGWYVPMRHKDSANIPPAVAAEILRPLMQSGRVVCHNAKFEVRNCEMPESVGGFGYPVSVLSCSQMMLFVLQILRRGQYGLKDCSKRLLGHEMSELTSLFQVGDKKLTSKQQSVLNCHDLEVTPSVVKYGVEDSAVCLALHEKYFSLVENSFIFKLEMQLLPVVAAMDAIGVKYDWDLLKAQEPKAQEFLVLLESEILDDFEQLTGRKFVRSGAGKFNLGSAPQLREVLFDELGMRVFAKTDTGLASTSEDALEHLKSEHEVVQKILWYRKVDKSLNTYIKKYPVSFGYAEDGRTHPDLNAMGVFTGRFSVSDPPYHATPKKTEYRLRSGHRYGFDFRRAVVPETGRYFLYFDYSQVELRVIAGEAQEPSLLQAFANGEDIHSRTSALMLGIPIDEVTDADRAKGKTWNFALAYGQGIEALAQSVGVSVQEAAKLNDSYFAALPRLQAWQEKTKSEASERGYSQSRFGRRHKIWEYESPYKGIRAKGHRIACNAPLQGGAADYMKIAMLRVHRRLASTGLDSSVRLIMNNHDSLMFEVDDSHVPSDLISVLSPEVTFPVEGWPEIVADWAVGQNWADLVEYGPEYEGLTPREIFERQPQEVEVSPPPPKESDAPQVEAVAPAVPSEPLVAVPMDVVVECESQPSREQVLKLRDFLKPGMDKVTIAFGGQSIVAVDVACPRHLWPSLKVLLGGGVEVRLNHDTLDLSSILEAM